MTEILLCRVDELVDGAGKAFTLSDTEPPRDVFAVRRGAHAYVYRNSCPHTGVALNWGADQFMSYDGVYIQCSLHFAQFRIDTGYCVYGPCVGQSLIPVMAQIRNGEVWVESGR